MQHRNKNIAEVHNWFAWHPVRVVVRGTEGPRFYTVWLRNVKRKAVVIQGSLQWAYEL